jgi:uncharacterized repeat protein (TIGR01451 family)
MSDRASTARARSERVWVWQRRPLIFVLALLASLVPALAPASASAQELEPAELAILGVDGLPDPAFVGHDVTYQVVVENRGPGTATGVEVTTRLPAAVSFQPAGSDGACSAADDLVTCRFSSLSAPGLVAMRFDVRPTVAGVLELTFTVAAEQPDPDLSNNSQTEATEVVEPADADVSIRLPGVVQAYAGVPTFYSAEIGNAGPATATGIVATIEFPPGLTVTATGCTNTEMGSTCRVSQESLPSGTGVIAVFQVTPSAAGSYAVSGRVTGDQPDPNLSDNVASGMIDVASAADVSVDIAESADPATPGQQLTYTVTVTNDGPSPASAVTVHNNWATTLRGDLRLLSVAASQGHCGPPAGNQLDCQLGDLSAASSATVRVAFRPQGAGSITYQAAASAAEFDGDTNNNADAETTVVGRR